MIKNMMPAIRCCSIDFFRNGRLILSNLSFKLEKGSILLIKGKNGAGKTTLLKLIARILDTYSGNIICSGTVAYLGHKHACKSHYTIKENLKFWGNIYNTLELIDPTLYLFNLFAIKDILYSALSSGYQKKVALAKLIMFNADIWLLDEPLANLDEENKKFIVELLQSKAQSGGAVIFSSHEDGNNIKGLQVLEI